MRAVVSVAVLGLGLSLLPSCAGREAAEPGDLLEDFDRLVELVERTHPDPYAAFGGATGFEAAVAESRERARRVDTRQELHAVAQRFLATLRDGHTSMAPPAVPEEGMEEGSVGWTGLRLGIATDAVFVREAVPELAAPVGSRLLAVNRLPLDRVLDSLRVRYPTENRYGTLERLRRLLEGGREGRPPVLGGADPLPLTLETPAGDTVSVVLTYGRNRPDPGGGRSSLDLAGDNGLLHGTIVEHRGLPVGYFVWNAVVSREVAEAAWRRDPSTAGGTFDWVFSYLPEARRTGDLEEDLELVPSLYDRFSRLLDEMRSRAARHLVIDLRKNNGGMTPLVYPLLFMLHGDAVLESPVEARYDVRISRLYLAKQGFDDIDEYNARRGTDLALGDVRRGYLFRNDPARSLEERRRAGEWTFAGYGREFVERGAPLLESPRVVVLTSATTFSAAFHLVYYLTEIGSATVVGVPPRQAPNAFMESTPFELPGSGLRGSISNAVQVLYPPGDERARVFTPDHPMSWNDFRRYDFDPNAEVLYALDLTASGPPPR